MGISTIIIYYILTCLTSLMILCIYAKYNKNKIKVKSTIILKIMCISLFTCICNMFVPSYLRGICAIVSLFLLFLWIFKDNVKNTLYYTIIIGCAIQVLELLIAFFLPLTIKNIDAFNQSIWFKTGLSIIDYMLLYIILTNKYVMNFFKKLKDIIKGNTILFVAGIVGVLICNFWGFYVAENTADKSLTVIVCFTEIIIIALLLILLRNKYEKSITKIKEEQLKQNLNFYEQVSFEYKELKHNLMNDLLTIKTKVPKKEQTFINEVINKYKSNYDWISNVNEIPEGLQGLVFLKKSIAENQNILFNLEYKIDKKIEQSFNINNDFKLYETLGILFDNAIEAANESTEKIINVVFTHKDNNLHISILNTFNNEIDLEKLGDKNYSTKNRGSGIGLHYINKNNKSKFKLEQSIKDNIFISSIVIKNNK